MMHRVPIDRVFPIKLIVLQCLLITLANSLSITPGPGGMKSGGGANANGRTTAYNAQLQQQPVATNTVQQPKQQQQPTQPMPTTLPPLMTTIVQNTNNPSVESSSSSSSIDGLRPVEYQQQQQQPNDGGGAKFRSNLDDHDDSVPLATINNHSKNNAQIRPPQYVDVSALVGVSRHHHPMHQLHWPLSPH